MRIERGNSHRTSPQEKLHKAADQMKHEQARIKQAGENAKAQQDGAKILAICREIARRIVNGDQVPRKDHKYLMEHDMELYARSISLRRHKEKPRKYDQLSEDEKSPLSQSLPDAQNSAGSESPLLLAKLDDSI